MRVQRKILTFKGVKLFYLLILIEVFKNATRLS
jgi:hypothetical protein